MSISILLLGYKGYVGSALYKELSKDFHFLITGIDRQTYQELNYNKKYDYIINCAMPSARFAAQNDPIADYYGTVAKTAEFYYGLKYNKFIQISSISVRTENNVYGRHKAAAEAIIDVKNHLIFRLTATYDDSLTKGVVYDLINNNPIYVSNQSSYSFAPLSYVVKYISDNLSKTGIIEVGGRNAISLGAICFMIPDLERNFKSAYIDNQEVILKDKYDISIPNSYEVVEYIEEQINKKERGRILAIGNKFLSDKETGKIEMKKFYNEAERS